MIVPDVNLLLYAYNVESSCHRTASLWWRKCLGGAETVGLTVPVLMGFMRIATSSRVFAYPLSVPEASRAVRLWMERPNVQLLETRETHLIRALAMLEALGTGGNLVSDAQIAALAIEANAVVHTADADFTRFPGVRWLNPISGAEG